jgi:hypothetical protein
MDSLNITILIILIILVCVIISFCVEFSIDYNFHEYFNPKLYNKYGNHLIHNDNEYIKNVIIGKKKTAESKIVICSLARNISDIFEKSKSRLEYIGSFFNEYKIILFENDSYDDSRELLKSWTHSNNNVILLECCDFTNCDCKLKTKTGYEYGSFSKERLSKMAFYRQQYLNFVNKYFKNFDYMLVVDFDLNGCINVNGLFDSIAKEEWGAIFCNGRISIPGLFGLKTFPYDSIAVLFMEDDYNIKSYDFIETINKTLKMEYNGYNSHYYEIKSAFNGYGLYKIKNLEGCSYISNSNACEHINLAKCLHDKGEKMYINYYWDGYFNRQGDSLINILKSFFFNN